MCDQWVYDPRLGHQDPIGGKPYVPQPKTRHCPREATHEAYCVTYAYGRQMPLSQERRRVCLKCATLLSKVQQMPLRSRLDASDARVRPATYILITIRPLGLKARAAQERGR